MPKHTRGMDDGDSTRDRALAIAIRLIQERGYNGFSFQDIAKELGISHVAVHHHFATKADLVTAAIRHYSEAFAAELRAIDQQQMAPAAALRSFAQLFRATLADGSRICLCGMLTAELTSLPDQATPLLRRFYEDNEAWLTGVLRRSQSLSAARAATLAAAFLAALEGAMMSARAFGDERRLADAAEWLISHLAESAQALRKQPARRRTRA